MKINKLIHLKLLFCQKLLCFPSEVGCRLSGPEVMLKRMLIMFSELISNIWWHISSQFSLMTKHCTYMEVFTGFKKHVK